jgi:predicted ATP-grasp superfamily ATP-dependent carboligase
MDMAKIHTEISHLGVLIGPPDTRRIIALSTSGVFQDHSLIRRYKNIDPDEINSGIQAHLYTRPQDIFIIKLPRGNPSEMIKKIIISLETNAAIWKRLTGISLINSSGTIILVSSGKVLEEEIHQHLPANFRWHTGHLLSSAAKYYHHTHSFYAFIFDECTIRALGLYGKLDEKQKNQIRTTVSLMNKNKSMQFLQANKTICPKTYTFNRSDYSAAKINQMENNSLYVYKPAGGAAGIGVFDNGGKGLTLRQANDHILQLNIDHLLPEQFQVQEFLPGTPYGVTGLFHDNQHVEILEIHEQTINNDLRCTGCRWTPGIQDLQVQNAEQICRQLSSVPGLSLYGLVNFDMIDGKVIEVNPRITASAPVSHLLNLQPELMQFIGKEFRIRQIDIQTNIPLPFECIHSGKLQRLIQQIRDRCGVLILPQGLNPFGNSRFIFVNDDHSGTAQQLFIQGIGKQGESLT